MEHNNLFNVGDQVVWKRFVETGEIPCEHCDNGSHEVGTLFETVHEIIDVEATFYPGRVVYSYVLDTSWKDSETGEMNECWKTVSENALTLPKKVIKTTEEQLEKAFAEYYRRAAEHPEDFLQDAVIANFEEAGKNSAAYLVGILKELNGEE